MKNVFPPLLVLLFGIALFTLACGKKDITPPGVNAGSGKVTAMIDGMDWTSKDGNDGAVFISSQGSNIIQAYAEDGSYISLNMFGSLSSGMTIEVSNSGIFQANYKPDFSGAESFAALGELGSGKTTISNFSGSNIKGTFQFTGVRQNADGSKTEKVISSGTYDINF